MKRTTIFLLLIIALLAASCVNLRTVPTKKSTAIKRAEKAALYLDKIEKTYPNDLRTIFRVDTFNIDRTIVITDTIVDQRRVDNLVDQIAELARKDAAIESDIRKSYVEIYNQLNTEHITVESIQSIALADVTRELDALLTAQQSAFDNISTLRSDTEVRAQRALRQAQAIRADIDRIKRDAIAAIINDTTYRLYEKIEALSSRSDTLRLTVTVDVEITENGVIKTVVSHEDVQISTSRIDTNQPTFWITFGNRILLLIILTIVAYLVYKGIKANIFVELWNRIK